jgi:hypothetical protein
MDGVKKCVIRVKNVGEFSETIAKGNMEILPLLCVLSPRLSTLHALLKSALFLWCSPGGCIRYLSY